MLGLWDGNPVKLDCYDHYTTTDMINSFELKKKKKRKKEKKREKKAKAKRQQSREQVLTCQGICQQLGLGLSNLQNMRNKCLLFISQSIYGVFFFGGGAALFVLSVAA